MKYITVNQLRFGAALLVITIAFRIGLSRLLDANEFTTVWLIAVLYGVAIFAPVGFLVERITKRCPFTILASGFT